MHFKSILEVEEFKKKLEPLSSGIQGSCYLEVSSNTVYKLFEGWDEDDFDDFTSEEILQFDDVKTRTFVFPNDCLYLNGRVIGYTSKFKLGRLLWEIDPLTVDLNKFLGMLEVAIEDIKYISKQGVNVYDIMYNIMLGDGIFVIDTVEYTRSPGAQDEKFDRNAKGFNLEVIRFLIDGYFDELLLHNEILLKMYRSSGLNMSVVDFVIILKNYISATIGHEIKTLGEARELMNKEDRKRLYFRKEKLVPVIL